MCFGTEGSSEAASPARGARPGAEGRKGSRARVARRRELAGGLPPAKLDQLSAEMRRLREAMLAERKREADRLVADAVARGEDGDRGHWTIVYDQEMAPPSTGRALILEHRIVPMPPQDLVDPDDLHDELWTVIEALAASGVYLVNTDHLADRDLYCRLYYRILDEPTRLMPPEAEAAEFIDCLHPLDIEVGRTALAVVRRNEAGPVVRAEGAGLRRGPGCGRALADRDRWLPVPAWT